MSKTKVLIVDNSIDSVNTLINTLSTDRDIEVAGVAITSKQAVNLVANLKPDIITISDSLDNSAGASMRQLVKEIMAFNPTPILVITDSRTSAIHKDAINAISMGALDIIDIMSIPKSETIQKIKLLSSIKVVTHLAGKLEKNGYTNTQRLENATRVNTGDLIIPDKIIAIAASTGGPSALVEVLHKIPGGLNLCILVVQHVAEGFCNSLAEWLDRECPFNVRVAADGNWIKAGYVYIAPSGLHMVASNRCRLALNNNPPVSGHRPSADVLFASVAKAYGANSMGVVLTGMGSDGANGIIAIKFAGGSTIAQSEQGCVVFGMPKSAIQTGSVDKVVPLSSIADEVMKFYDK
jgi:two-component system chemotaxis response regulator CheB